VKESGCCSCLLVPRRRQSRDTQKYCLTISCTSNASDFGRMNWNLDHQTVGATCRYPGILGACLNHDILLLLCEHLFLFLPTCVWCIYPWIPVCLGGSSCPLWDQFNQADVCLLFCPGLWIRCRSVFTIFLWLHTIGWDVLGFMMLLPQSYAAQLPYMTELVLGAQANVPGGPNAHWICGFPNSLGGLNVWTMCLDDVFGDSW